MLRRTRAVTDFELREKRIHNSVDIMKSYNEETD